MHFAIQKDVLVRALRDVGNAIANRVVQPVLSNVFIESADSTSLRFVGTDLDLVIETKCAAVVYSEGSITLPSKKLLEIVSKLANDLVSFQVNKDSLETTITCQKSKFTLVGISSEDYPKLPDTKSAQGFTMPTDILCRSIMQTSFAAANYDSSSILGGVFIVVDNGVFETVATDGSRMANRKEFLTVSAPVASKKKDKKSDKELDAKASTATLDKPNSLKAIVPARACTELMKFLDIKEIGQTIKIAYLDSYIVFSTDTHTLTSRLINGEYPHYSELFPAEHTYYASFNREEALAVIERIAVMSDDRTNLIKFHFEGENMQVSANTPDLGRAQEEINVHFEGQVIDVAVNVRYVLDVLQKLSADQMELEMTGPLKPLIFKAKGDDNYRYLLMPVQAR
jgi:DNA polymerase-3 subunit beta